MLSVIMLSVVLAFIFIFRNLLVSPKALTKLPQPPSPKKQPQPSAFIKNFPAF
jgi:hypothetical protein